MLYRILLVGALVASMLVAGCPKKDDTGAPATGTPQSTTTPGEGNGTEGDAGSSGG